ncbi:MAG: hypothetical protein Q9171_000681 [Xanthocarpia ochracea]
MESPCRMRFKEPKHKTGHFNFNRPELIKANIDLRPPPLALGYGPPPSIIPGNVFANRAQGQQDKGNHLSCQNFPYTVTDPAPQPPQQQSTPSSSRQGEVPELFARKENQPPLQDKNIKPFGSGFPPAKGTYFGGPIFDKSILRWRETLYTRSNGEVVGAVEQNVPLPANMGHIIRSVCAFGSRTKHQTAIWVGPRLLLTTLHFHDWFGDIPTDAELNTLLKSGTRFAVESEICSRLISAASPMVQMIDHDASNDLGLFRLADESPDRTEWVDPAWLADRDEIYEAEPTPGRIVACVGFSGSIHGDDANAVRKNADDQVNWLLTPHQRVIHTNFFDLHKVTKPEMMSFCPGHLDSGDTNEARMILGVSCTLWKGSSGGPCVLLDGLGAGRIIGLGMRAARLFSLPAVLRSPSPRTCTPLRRNTSHATAHLHSSSPFLRLLARNINRRPVRHVLSKRFNSNKPPYNPTEHLGSPEPSLSLSQRLRKLSREYGWSALGVYLLLSALDFPFCFLAVRWVGTERIGHWESVIVEGFWKIFRYIYPFDSGQDGSQSVGIESAGVKVEAFGNVNSKNDEVGVPGYDHGVNEAEERNKSEDASLWTQLALAYAIHKSFIFIRVPLTAAVTPKVVKVLRGWGWDIGKRRPKGTKSGPKN